MVDGFQRIFSVGYIVMEREMQVNAFNSSVIFLTSSARFTAISLLQKGIIQIFIITTTPLPASSR